MSKITKLECFENPLTVRLAERSYPIWIQQGLINGNWNLSGFDMMQKQSSRVVIITDHNVDALYGHALCEVWSCEMAVSKLVVRPGETSKQVAVLEQLWHSLCELGADRKTWICALGGGVVGDLAGFVAATFLRGVPLVQIPTTLLAQVDSSVGGKVGINLPMGKNLVGSFLQPRWVAIDPGTLQTLEPREFQAGLAEVVKYGMILDAPFFAWLEENVNPILALDGPTMQNLIARCCQNKARIVQEDEQEISGRRALLNYGHTLGHAIEAVAGYGEFLHGEAIAIGMQFAIVLARRLGRVEMEMVERQRELLERFGLATTVDRQKIPFASLVDLMARDKKTQQGHLRFVLPDKIGHGDLVEGIPMAELEAAFEEANS